MMRNNTKLFFPPIHLGLGCGGGCELTGCGNSEILLLAEVLNFVCSSVFLGIPFLCPGENGPCASVYPRTEP